VGWMTLFLAKSRVEPAPAAVFETGHRLMAGHAGRFGLLVAETREAAPRARSGDQEGPTALGMMRESCDAFDMWTDQRGSELLFLAECRRLLASAAKEGLTGRLGISTQQAPIIQPVNFAYHHNQIVVRLGSGHMADIISGALVAFEVDHVDHEAQTAWSVLVRGLATPLEGSEGRAAAKFAPTPLVPAPGDAVFVVRLDVVTGRRFPLEKTQAGSAGHNTGRAPRGTSATKRRDGNAQGPDATPTSPP
jgi:uncharacterized protein